jgi:hypothetical protein
MAINDVSRVSSTTNGDAERFIPQVSRELRKQMGRYRALAAFQALADGGGGEKRIGNQILTAFEQFPHIINPKVTIAASIGDTTLNLTETRFLVRGTLIHDPLSGKTIRVTADPSPIDGGVVSVTALESAIPVGTTVISGPQNAPEGWLRPSPVSRSVEHFREAVGTYMWSFADTMHSKHYDQYYGDEEARLMADGTNEFNRALNVLLYTSEFRDGTPTGANDGNTQFRGLIQRGEANKHAVNGVLRMGELYDILYPSYRNRATEASPPFRIFCSQRLINESSLAFITHPGLQTRPGDNTLGSRVPSLITPMDIDLRFLPDCFFDESPEYQNMVLMVNLSEIKPLGFGLDLKLGPTAEHPEGIADRGTGVRQWMMLRAMGLRSMTQYWSVIKLLNVTRITD